MALGPFLICISRSGFPELQIPADLWDFKGTLVQLFFPLAFPTPGVVFSLLVICVFPHEPLHAPRFSALPAPLGTLFRLAP